MKIQSYISKKLWRLRKFEFTRRNISFVNFLLFLTSSDPEKLRKGTKLLKLSFKMPPPPKKINRKDLVSLASLKVLFR